MMVDMKKILVLSDSHRNSTNLIRIIRKERDADRIVFLGDGIDEFEDCMCEVFGMTENNLCVVRGNCDIGSMNPVCEEFEINGNMVFCTHGDSFEVKNGLEELTKEAEKRGCNIVLFGHTHVPISLKTSNVMLFNPGAISSGEYGIINFSDNSKIEFVHRIS